MASNDKVKLVSKDGQHTVELPANDKAEINRFRYGLGYSEPKVRKSEGK